MSTLKLGERVTFQNESGAWTDGSVWALAHTANTYWIIDADGRVFHRARSDLNTKQLGNTQDVLPDCNTATPVLHTQHTQLELTA